LNALACDEIFRARVAVSGGLEQLEIKTEGQVKSPIQGVLIYEIGEDKMWASLL